MYFSVNNKGELSDLKVNIIQSGSYHDMIMIYRRREPGEVAWVRLTDVVLFHDVSKLDRRVQRTRTSTLLWKKYSFIEFYDYISKLRNG